MKYKNLPRFVYLRMAFWGLMHHPHGQAIQIFWQPPITIRPCIYESNAITVALHRPEFWLHIPSTIHFAYCKAHNLDPGFDAPF